ncbi:MAG: polysaccharide biosynthesis protein [Brooklawnia sp.]|jgi:FlaA1/EpsC-like NDP-sugar epimerase
MTAAVYKIPITWRLVILFIWDTLAWGIALTVLLVVRYDFRMSRDRWVAVLTYTGIAVVLQIAASLLARRIFGRNRVGSFSEALALSATVLTITVPLGLVMSVVSPNFPHGVGLVLPPMALTVMAAGRGFFRLAKDASHPGPNQDAVPALIYGAGNAGHQVAQLVDIAENPPYSIVGFIDDDPDKRQLRVRSHRVHGSGDDLVRVARERGAHTVILAISKASSKLLQDVAAKCDANGLKFVVLPPVREMIGGQVSLGDLREFNVIDLLGRRPVETDLSKIAGYINGKRVLVTGAGGSIGAELARQVHKLGPSQLVLLDRDESALHAVQLSLYGVGLLDGDDTVLCDIRDREALQQVFDHHRPEVVFHAAALKHLPMLERYPAEGWKTNVLGTLNVLRCAEQTGVRHFVNISTDKAADASSVLGRTKRVAERLTAWHARHFDLPYLSVRFGNVLGSRGSVLHTFQAQIERGGPVTVTHPDVTRYFMTIPEACELVLQAGAIGAPGEVLVLDMGEPIRIMDMAERLITESGKRVEIHFTGLRDGEKLHEVLFSDSEHGEPSDHPLIQGMRVPELAPSKILDQPLQPDGAAPVLQHDFGIAR